ncbi:MAG: response regulator, partial [Planctomycetota bacterium]
SDPVRLRQILLNLVGNAVKFTSHGEVRLVVRAIDVDTERPRMVFEVSDTGPGISKEQLGRLFRPFQQLESRTVADESGTGLGLVISRRLAQELGGDIEVESEPGKGSTFRVTIDIGPLDGVRMLDNPKEAQQRREPKNLAKNTQFRGRVLLAEDGPENRRLITYILKKAGVDVTAVEDGQQACRAALDALRKGEPFDLILMDMQMPVMDGYEAVRRLRAEGYKHPIAALTAHAMESDREICIQAGCDAYATKPINRENLFTLLREYLIELETAAS